MPNSKRLPHLVVEALRKIRGLEAHEFRGLAPRHGRLRIAHYQLDQLPNPVTRVAIVLVFLCFSFIALAWSCSNGMVRRQTTAEKFSA
jgi:hypothetical protein